jgi:hypothetical protein
MPDSQQTGRMNGRATPRRESPDRIRGPELPLAEASRRLRLNPPTWRFPRLARRPRRTTPPCDGEPATAPPNQPPDGGHGSRRVSVPTTAPTSSGMGWPMPIPGSIELHREELYELVWSEPVEKIAAQYGISGRGLAKICRRLDIPVPPRGYWAQRQHGHNPERLPLPTASRGVPTTVTIRGDAVETSCTPTLPPDVLADVAREQQPEHRIRVPERVARFTRACAPPARLSKGRRRTSTGSSGRGPRAGSPAGSPCWTSAWPGPRSPGRSASWTPC